MGFKPPKGPEKGPEPIQMTLGKGTLEPFKKDGDTLVRCTLAEAVYIRWTPDGA